VFTLQGREVHTERIVPGILSQNDKDADKWATTDDIFFICPFKYIDKCDISQSHRIVGVGRDLCGSSSPTLLPKQGHLEQAAKDLVQAGLWFGVFSVKGDTEKN